MVGQHYDGLAVGRDLHRPRRDAVGQNVRAVFHRNGRPRQLAGHAVAVGGQRINAVGKGAQAVGGKGGVLRASHGTQQRQGLRVLHAHRVRSGADAGIAQRAAQLADGNRLPQRRCIARAGGQVVAFCQLAALYAADTALYIGGTAAQHRRGGNAAAHGQIAAQPGSCHAHLQCAACLRQQRCVIRHGGAVQRGGAFRPGQRKNGVLFKPQGRAAQGTFQHRRARRVADKRIAQAIRVTVRRAAGTVALRGIAKAACILHGGQWAGIQHGNAHTVPSFCARASNSACVMGVKRMRSPAA